MPPLPTARMTPCATWSVGVDWPRFVRLARFHRIQGLVWQRLAPLTDAVPHASARELAADAAQIAGANLRSAVECRDLLSAFTRAEIPLLFVKGLTLASLAYGNISAKSGIDIDLLVPPEKLRAAAGLLLERGIKRSCRAGCAIAIGSRPGIVSARNWCGSTPSGNSRSTCTPASSIIRDCCLRWGSIRRCTQSTIASGIELPTLRTEELFAYLAVHGASSAWFRLKWITDVAALLHPDRTG